MGIVQKPKVYLDGMSWEEFCERTDRGVKAGIREAILEHKIHGRSIVVERDGKIVEIPADEIQIDDAPSP